MFSVLLKTSDDSVGDGKTTDIKKNEYASDFSFTILNIKKSTKPNPFGNRLTLETNREKKYTKWLIISFFFVQYIQLKIYLCNKRKNNP